MSRNKLVQAARDNLVQGENGDLFGDSHSILNGWKKYLSAIECICG